jgi:hypothetical protein
VRITQKAGFDRRFFITQRSICESLRQGGEPF